jgi:2-polyprenyl-3-methyl-5-hydroxy-6-metoxy-1,4-benzoquinol methylase
MKGVTRRSACRLCGSAALECVLPILPSAVGDAFVPASRLSETQDLYPLDCYLCLDCGHLQNLDVVDPDVLFREYTYRTSVSLGLVEHFRKYAEDCAVDLGFAEGGLVVEIGSNDGSLLKAFKKLGMRVVGVDPARNIAAAATAEGVPTIPEFFTSQIAAAILADHGPADLFCANNVFAHIDNMSDIATGIRILLGSNGVFVFEVSYIVDMIDNMVFDTIYHEHVSHHALQPLEAFLNRHDLTLFDAMRAETKGGSIRGFAQPLAAASRPRSERLKKMIAEEYRRGVTTPQVYLEWFNAIEARKRAILAHVDNAIASGKTIAGYGASTTTTTLLYHFELEKRLKFIIDDNPLKQGMFSPGAHIPVVASSELVSRKPEIVVILAWVYADPIVKRNQAYVDAGGRFLVPLPEMRLIGSG